MLSAISAPSLPPQMSTAPPMLSAISAPSLPPHMPMCPSIGIDPRIVGVLPPPTLPPRMPMCSAVGMHPRVVGVLPPPSLPPLLVAANMESSVLSAPTLDGAKKAAKVVEDKETKIAPPELIRELTASEMARDSEHALAKLVRRGWTKVKAVTTVLGSGSAAAERIKTREEAEAAAEETRAAAERAAVEEKLKEEKDASAKAHAVEVARNEWASLHILLKASAAVKKAAEITAARKAAEEQAALEQAAAVRAAREKKKQVEMHAAEAARQEWKALHVLLKSAHLCDAARATAEAMQRQAAERVEEASIEAEAERAAAAAMAAKKQIKERAARRAAEEQAALEQAIANRLAEEKRVAVEDAKAKAEAAEAARREWNTLRLMLKHSEMRANAGLRDSARACTEVAEREAAERAKTADTEAAVALAVMRNMTDQKKPTADASATSDAESMVAAMSTVVEAPSAPLKKMGVSWAWLCAIIIATIFIGLNYEAVKRASMAAAAATHAISYEAMRSSVVAAAARAITTVGATGYPAATPTTDASYTRILSCIIGGPAFLFAACSLLRSTVVEAGETDQEDGLDGASPRRRAASPAGRRSPSPAQARTGQRQRTC